MDLGVYSETLSPKEIEKADIVPLLGSLGVTLAQAVPFRNEDCDFDPDQVLPYLELGCRLREYGGRYALWPLLPKVHGYWINERNLDAVDAMADALLEGAHRFGAAPDLLVADVETPWQQMEKAFLPGSSLPDRIGTLIRMYAGNRNPKRFATSVHRLTRIVRRLRQGLAPVSAAVFPFLIADLMNDGHMLQDLLEMPVFPVPFDAYNVMFYNSYIPALAPFLLPKDGADRALYEYMSALTARIGPKTWITLGSTYEGVLPGTEGMVYTAPADMVRDIGAAKAAGVDTIWIYCLEGILFSNIKQARRRTTRESRAFFETILDTPAKRPHPHPGWTLRRTILERVVKDRRKGSYDWS